jgi:hypothetical protein
LAGSVEDGIDCGRVQPISSRATSMRTSGAASTPGGAAKAHGNAWRADAEPGRNGMAGEAAPASASVAAQAALVG